MESGVADVVGSALGPALKAARDELKSEKFGLQPQQQRVSPTRNPRPVSTLSQFDPVSGFQVPMDAIDALRHPPSQSDAYSFLVEPPRNPGQDLLTGGAGLLWNSANDLTPGMAGSTPGATVPTGLFFQTGPAMQAFLAQRVVNGGGGAATPAFALGMGMPYNSEPASSRYLSYSNTNS